MSFLELVVVFRGIRTELHPFQNNFRLIFSSLACAFVFLSRWVSRSEMKDEDEAESRRARTFMTDPLGEWISTLQVISRESEARPVATLDVTRLIGYDEGCVDDRVDSESFGSTCNNEWCGF